MNYVTIVFFFFQAEDGIRDYKVTGVQTCALPISSSVAQSAQNKRRGFDGLVQCALSGVFRSSTSLIHVLPMPCTTRFNLMRSAFCPFSRKNGISYSAQSVVDRTALFRPLEKNSPRPGTRHHISRKARPCKLSVFILALKVSMHCSAPSLGTSNRLTVWSPRESTSQPS